MSGTALSARDLLAAAASGQGAKDLKTLLDALVDLANDTRDKANRGFRALFRGSAGTTYAAPGALTYAAPSAQTSADLTNSTGATPDTTIVQVDSPVGGSTDPNAALKSDVNNRLTLVNANFSDLAYQMDKHTVEIASLRAQLVALGGTDVPAIRTATLALAADVATAFDGGAPHHKFYDDVTTLDALPYASTTDNDTIFDLANALKVAYEAHRVRVSGVHNAADSTNAISAADATDLASAYTLLNELKADYNAHRTQAGSHFMSDSTNSIAASNASTAGTAVTLANELKDDLISHLRFTTDVYQPAAS